jgi:uncharacterized protein (DUF433 family)
MLTLQQIESHIHRNPDVLGGKPIIRGTRVAVSLIADWIDAGVPVAQILADYPNLTRDDIEAAVAYTKRERAQIDVRAS